MLYFKVYCIFSDECGALESVKAASELYSPVSGRVVEKNTSVEDTPSLINTSCYENGERNFMKRGKIANFLLVGWLFKVELADEQEVTGLMNEDQYKEFLKSDEHH